MILRRHGALPALTLLLVSASSAGAEVSFCSRTDVRLRTNAPNSVAIADFYPGNGLDLAITFGTSRKLSLWRNDGSGNFTETDVIVAPSEVPAPTQSVIGDPTAIIAEDFNGDGLVDIAGTNDTAPRYFAYPNPGVAGSWGTPSTTAIPGRTDANDMTAVFWNADRALDIVMADRAGTVSVALGEVDGTTGDPLGRWGTVQRFTSPANPGVFTDVEVANFFYETGAGDTLLDILAVDNQYSQLVIWPGFPGRDGYVRTGASELKLIPVTDAAGGLLSPVEAVLGDWGNDGYADVLVATTEGVVLFYRGNGGPTSFDPPVRHDLVASFGLAGRMPTDWSAMIHEDVVGNDSIRDLIIADAGEAGVTRGFNWLTVIPGLTDGAQAPSFDATAQLHYAMGNLAPLRPGSVAVGQLDGVGGPDIVVLHGDQGSMTLLRSDGADGFDAPRSFSVGGLLPRGLASGRLDGDAQEEVVTALTSPGQPSLRTAIVLRGASGGTLGAPVALAPPGLASPLAVTVASINTAEDATNDVLVTFAADQALWEGRGDGTFTAPTLASAPGRIELGQIYGSTAPDLVAIARTARNQVLSYEGDGRGAFTLRQSFDLVYGVSDLALGQFFGTGGTDIVVSGVDLGGRFGLYLIRWNAATLMYDAPEFLPIEDLGLLNDDLPFLETAQIDGVGPPEIVAVAPAGEAYILKVSGTSFVLDPANIFLAFGGSPKGVVVRDLTGDGIVDIAIAERAAVNIREGLPGGTFGPIVSLLSNIDNSGLAAADLDGDGLPELVTVSANTADVTVFCNQSVGSLLLRVGRPFTRDTVHWTDQGPGALFQVASGTINGLWATGTLGDAACLGATAATQYVDARPLPAPAPPTNRSGYYYLVKCAGGDCTEPDFGTTSLNQPRFGLLSPGAVPDPCP